MGARDFKRKVFLYIIMLSIIGNFNLTYADDFDLSSSEDNSTGDTNTGDTSTDDTNTGDTSTGNTSAGDTSTGDISTDDTSTDDTSTDDTSTGDTSTDDTSTDDTSTNEPSTNDPSTNEPSTDEPSTNEPSTDEPSTDEPSTDEPNIDEPSTDEPSTDEPSIDEPSIDEPSTDEPSTDEPSTDEPSTDNDKNINDSLAGGAGGNSIMSQEQLQPNLLLKASTISEFPSDGILTISKSTPGNTLQQKVETIINNHNTKYPDNTIGTYSINGYIFDDGYVLTSADYTYMKKQYFKYLEVKDIATFPGGKIPVEAFRYSYINTLKIPDGITEIGARAFENGHLETFICPATTNLKIEEKAFYGIPNLTDVDFINVSGTLTIGANGFMNCKNLTYIRVPADTNATDVFEANTSKKIQACLIYRDGTDLTTLTFEGKWFNNMEKLFHFMGGYFGNVYAFANSGSGDDIPIYHKFLGSCDVSLHQYPGKEIDEAVETTLHEKYGPSKNIADITKLYISSDIPSKDSKLSSEIYTGVKTLDINSLYFKNNYLNIGFVRNLPSLETVTINYYTTVLGESAFENCPNLKTFNFSISTNPSGVKTIEKNAFKDCINLTTLGRMSQKIETIDVGAFENCNSLVTFNFTDTVKFIGTSAFRNTALAEVKITNPEAVIQDGAFAGNSNLKSISLSESVTIEGNPFAQCDNIQSFTLVMKDTNISEEEAYVKWLEKALEVFPDMSKEEIYNQITPSIMKQTDTISTSLAKVPLIDWNEEVQLDSSDIGSSLQDKIDTMLIMCKETKNYTDIRKLKLNGYTITEDDCIFIRQNLSPTKRLISFMSADGLELDFENSTFYNNTIPDGAFQGMANLENIVLPASLSEIGTDAFSGTAITTIDLSKGAITTKERAFKDCTNLTSIKIAKDFKDNITDTTVFENCPISIVNVYYGAEDIADIDYYDWKRQAAVLPASTDYGKIQAKISNYLGESTLAKPIFSGTLTIHSDSTKDLSQQIKDEIFNLYGVDVEATDITKLIITGAIGRNSKLDKNTYSGLIELDLSQAIFSEADGSGINEMNAGFCEGITDLTYVTFNDSLRKVGDTAFKDCINLTAVQIPAQLEQIGKEAFFQTGITTIDLSKNSISAIGEKAFSNCKNLISLKIAKGFKDAITDNMIFENSPIELINVFYNTEDITNIGYYDWKKQASVLPANIDYTKIQAIVSDISKEATLTKPIFTGELTVNVVAQKDLNTQISDTLYKLYENEAATEDITKLVITGAIGRGYVLDKSKYIKLTELDLSQAVFTETDGSGINEMNTGFCEGMDITTIKLNHSLKKIGNTSFKDCKNLTVMQFPAQLETIGNEAFKNSALTAVSFPDSLIEIQDMAFTSCGAITAIDLPQNVKKVGKQAFAETGITTLNLSKNNIAIAEKAFQGCKALTSVKIPKDFKNSIADTTVFEDCPIQSINVFYGTESITDVDYYDWKRQAAILPMDADYTIIEAKISNNFKEITLTQPSFLGTLTVQSSETKNLNTQIQDTLYKLYENDAKVENITKLIITGTIGRNNVLDESIYSGLVELDLSQADFVNDEINESFCEGLSITYVKLNDSLRKIGNSAFKACKNLTSIQFPSKLESIGSKAFQNSGLISVSFPETLIEIGQQTFENSALTNIFIKNQKINIKSQAFANGNLIKTVAIPNESTIAVNAFEGCGKIEKLTIVYPNGENLNNKTYEDDWKPKAETILSSLETVIIAEVSDGINVKELKPTTEPTPPDEGGGETPTPPDEGGGETPTPPDEGGGETPTPPDGGGGETPTPPDGGGGETPTPPDEGGGETPTPPDEGGGETPTPPSGGGGSNTDSDSGGKEEVPDTQKEEEKKEEEQIVLPIDETIPLPENIKINGEEIKTLYVPGEYSLTAEVSDSKYKIVYCLDGGSYIELTNDGQKFILEYNQTRKISLKTINTETNNESKEVTFLVTTVSLVQNYVKLIERLYQEITAKEQEQQWEAGFDYPLKEEKAEIKGIVDLWNQMQAQPEILTTMGETIENKLNDMVKMLADILDIKAENITLTKSDTDRNTLRQLMTRSLEIKQIPYVKEESIEKITKLYEQLLQIEEFESMIKQKQKNGTLSLQDGNIYLDFPEELQNAIKDEIKNTINQEISSAYHETVGTAILSFDRNRNGDFMKGVMIADKDKIQDLINNHAFDTFLESDFYCTSLNGEKQPMKDVIQENKKLLREMKDRVEILEDTKEKIQSLPNPESIVPKVELLD